MAPKRSFGRRILRLFPLAVLLLASGCDATVEVQGRAYRWIDPPAGARSRLVVDEPAFSLPALPGRFEPLGDVDITLYNRTEYSHRKSRSWTHTDRSEPDGSFATGGVCAPGSYDMVIGALRPGCEAAVQTFGHDDRRPDHEATVLLICPHGVPKVPPRRHSPVLGN